VSVVPRHGDVAIVVLQRLPDGIERDQTADDRDGVSLLARAGVAEAPTVPMAMLSARPAAVRVREMRVMVFS
jgi:hypothetical protein